MSERVTITRHAATVLIGQLAVMAFGVTDTIVAGRDSEASLAALSVGSAIFISVYVALMGIFQALLPIWAEHRGARNLSMIGRSLRQALYLCAAACVLGMGILLSPEPLLRWTQVPEELSHEVEQYLSIVALALPPALLFRIYSTLNQALGLPKIVTILQLGSLLVKIPLSVWLTFGGAGVPALGVAGCAWATLVVNYGMLLVAMALLRSQDVYGPLALWRPIERPHGPTLRQFAKLGIPAGLSVMVEVTSFTLMALFVARQGTQSAAAHQIASNLAAVLYMVPLSLAIATSARVGYWRGAGLESEARRTVLGGAQLTLTLGMLSAGLLWATRHHVPAIYSNQFGVVIVTSSLLPWVALYHFADAVQTLCIFVLRCYRVTVVPLAVYSVLLWGAGLGGGYLLAYHHTGLVADRASPAPFWIASSAALVVTASIFAAMLWRVIASISSRHGQRETSSAGSQER